MSSSALMATSARAAEPVPQTVCSNGWSNPGRENRRKQQQWPAWSSSRGFAEGAWQMARSRLWPLLLPTGDAEVLLMEPGEVLM